MPFLKWRPDFFRGGAAFALLILFMLLPAALAAGEELSEREHTGLELQVELNRLGSSGDPLEREALLRRMVEECQGTEAAEAACWSLSDLYLDAFPDPRMKEAREALELFLKQYPDSPWAAQAKCRLFALYEGTDARSSQLKRELLADSGLPQGVKAFLKDGAVLPRLSLPAAPKKSEAPKKTVQKPASTKKASPAKKTPAKKASAKKAAPAKKKTASKKR